MKKLTAICCILLLFQSCTPKKTDDLNVRQIDINVEKARSVKFSEVFSSIELIPLANDSILGRVHKTIFSNNHIFFNCSNGIFIFDRQGRFQNKFNKHGDAPGEYKDSWDIGIADDKIEVMDRLRERVLSYKFDGTFTGEWKVGFRADQFCNLDNERYAFYRGNDKQKVQDFKLVLVSKSKNKVIDKALKIDSAQAKYLQFFDLTNFSTYKTQTTVMYSTSYIVYHIVDDKFLPRFKMDFGKHNIPDEFLNGNYRDISYFFEPFQKTDYAFLIDTFNESDNTIFFSFELGKEQKHVFLSKTTYESIVSQKMIDDIDNIFTMETNHEHRPKTITDNKLCYLIDPMEMTEKLIAFKQKNSSQQWEALLKKYPFFEGLITNAKPANNPFILLAKLK